MKSLFLATVLALASMPGVAANVDVGVSIGISQPGVYGRIDIGQFPQPQIIVQQPVIIGRPIVRPVQPVYMWVPVVHQQDWGRNCGRYVACGVPVYFVQDRWYRDHVMPVRHYEQRDDRRDDDRDERGHGHGKGHGKAHGNGGHKGR